MCFRSLRVLKPLTLNPQPKVLRAGQGFEKALLLCAPSNVPWRNGWDLGLVSLGFRVARCGGLQSVRVAFLCHHHTCLISSILLRVSKAYDNL